MSFWWTLRRASPSSSFTGEEPPLLTGDAGGISRPQGRLCDLGAVEVEQPIDARYPTLQVCPVNEKIFKMGDGLLRAMAPLPLVSEMFSALQQRSGRGRVDLAREALAGVRGSHA